MIRKFSIIAIVILAALPAVSCQSEKMTTVANQEASIDKYLEVQARDCQIVYGDHWARIVNTAGDSTSFVQGGDVVTAFIEGYVFSNGPSVLFCSDTLVFTAGSGRFIPGLDNGLMGASLKEKSMIVFSAKYGFYDEIVGVVPPMSPLIYSVEILAIDKKK